MCVAPRFSHGGIQKRFKELMPTMLLGNKYIHSLQCNVHCFGWFKRIGWKTEIAKENLHWPLLFECFIGAGAKGENSFTVSLFRKKHNIYVASRL